MNPVNRKYIAQILLFLKPAVAIFFTRLVTALVRGIIKRAPIASRAFKSLPRG